MALLLREADVERLVDMDVVMASVESAARDFGEGKAENQPRRRVMAPGGLLSVMFASYPGAGYTGLKAYTAAAGKVRFLVVLFNLDGSAAGLIEADLMGAFRTGAATGVAARALARPGPQTVAVIGAGWQARTQVLALKRALPVRELRVFSRDSERRRRFADEMGAVAAPSAEAAVRGASVVVTITNSAQPVLESEWVEAGTTVVGAGTNFPTRSELPAELVRRADLVVVDQVEAARLESGDLIQAGFDFEKAVELGAVLAGKAPGRRSDQDVVLFESHGLALWDLAAGAVVLEAARKAGVGEEVPLF
ncbi:MAG TPA: ornithine cyclodeaminase family protein [Candidatus Acidoferrales bacterium]|nr:ornithine cyclodeaminase family protein [Candidatus Acidoferrales bacterium]